MFTFSNMYIYRKMYALFYLCISPWLDTDTSKINHHVPGSWFENDHFIAGLSEFYVLTEYGRSLRFQWYQKWFFVQTSLQYWMIYVLIREEDGKFWMDLKCQNIVNFAHYHFENSLQKKEWHSEM